MDEIRLDLAEDATRQAILAQLRALLGEPAYAAVEEQVAPLRDSGAHFHDVGEVYGALASHCPDARAREDARAVYRILAEAEAQVHGCAVEETHFHEVGDAEAVANVLAVCLALRALGSPRVVATAVQTGEGIVRCAHGLLDIPAPATAAIIARGIPVRAAKLPGERCTPTSAALILHFVDEFAG